MWDYTVLILSTLSLLYFLNLYLRFPWKAT
jgi:hypothetical protein